MTHKHQRGWLKKEKRSQGETWVLFFRTVRKSDGKRVENKIPIGLLKDFSSKSCAWAEVERQHLHINQVDSRGGATFADLAHPSKSTHDNQRLRASAPQSTAATMGEPGRAGSRTAGGRGMVESLEAQRGPCKSNARQDAPCYVAGLQAQPTLRVDSSKSGVEPDALRPLQDHQRVRSDDSDPGTSIRSIA